MHPIEILEIYRARDLAKTDGAIPPLFPPDMYHSTKNQPSLMWNRKKHNETVRKDLRALAKLQKKKQKEQPIILKA